MQIVGKVKTLKYTRGDKTQKRLSHRLVTHKGTHAVTFS